jgi:hypothetical protein
MHVPCPGATDCLPRHGGGLASACRENRRRPRCRRHPLVVSTKKVPATTYRELRRRSASLPLISDLLALRRDFEQLADLPLLHEGMPQGKLRLDPVAVPPAMPLAHDVALFNELGQNPVGGSFGDPDGGGNVAQPDARVMSHTYKDVGVVCQKVPAGD